MSAELVTELQAKRRGATRAATWRIRIVLVLGPLTALSGLAWALIQPYRLTLIHPHGQGFWWLFSEPPLYVVLVGILFRLLIAPGLTKDLEEQ
ncbi:MAG TPA: hypothetical protein VHQ89_06110 [Gaiellaceae bacterium]|nr:hypothetical protein [Gaiellaceae bacterium]